MLDCYPILLKTLLGTPELLFFIVTPKAPNLIIETYFIKKQIAFGALLKCVYSKNEYAEPKVRVFYINKSSIEQSK